jgi:hypothetical protein
MYVTDEDNYIEDAHHFLLEYTNLYIMLQSFTVQSNWSQNNNFILQTMYVYFWARLYKNVLWYQRSTDIKFMQ